MSSIDRKFLISIIKMLMNQDQFDLIKHYQACIDKSTVPFSYKIQFRNGVCYMLSIIGAKKLDSFLVSKPSFIAIYEIIHLFEKYNNPKELKIKYDNIIQKIEKITLREEVCLNNLFETLFKTHQDSKFNFNKIYII